MAQKKNNELALALMNLEWINRHIGKVVQYLDERKEEDQYNYLWLSAKCKATAITDTLKGVTKTIRKEVAKGNPRAITSIKNIGKSTLDLQKEWQQQQKELQAQEQKRAQTKRANALKRKQLIN